MYEDLKSEISDFKSTSIPELERIQVRIAVDNA